MYAVIVDFTLRDDRVEAFRQRVGQQARDSLAREEGCHVFDVCIDPDDPLRVLLYELYSDRAAFDGHLQSAHFEAFDAAVADWVTDKQVRTMQRL